MNKKNKYGALVTLYPFLTSEEEYDTKNIGDYVQTIAGLQYFPRIDEYVERDAISDFCPREDTNIPVKVIMNAWWMWAPEKWPPANIISPLPISMHISPLHADEMLSGNGLLWFKRHEPIGCRDYGTIERLHMKGIECYYSGCLTLTLGRTYKPVAEEKRAGVCFADPYIDVPQTKIGKLLSLPHVFAAPRTIWKLSRNAFFSRSGYNNSMPFRKHRILKTLMMASLFHQQYSSYFSNSVLCNSEYISHVKIIKKGVDTSETLIKDADQLLKYYQTRKLVVTSRIHAALPCLAMETPVIFISNEKVENENWNANRLEGLTHLFRSMYITQTGLKTNDEVLQKIRYINHTTPLFANKLTWKSIANELEKKCDAFAKQ